MTKKIIEKEVQLCHQSMLDYSKVSEIIEFFQDVLEKHGDHKVTFEEEYSYGDTFDVVNLLVSREESDEEYAKRLKQEEETAERVSQKELRQLTELLTKYPNAVNTN